MNVGHSRHFRPTLAWGLLTLGISLFALTRWWLTWSVLGESDSIQSLTEVRFQVDINQASIAELQALPSVGPSLAARIVDHRQEQGPFGKLEDLCQVKGIGGAVFQQILPHLTIGPSSPQSLALAASETEE